MDNDKKIDGDKVTKTTEQIFQLFRDNEIEPSEGAAIAGIVMCASSLKRITHEMKEIQNKIRKHTVL